MKINLTFTHTDDPYMDGIEVDAVPREGEDFAIIPLDIMGLGNASQPRRIDRVARVRHYLVNKNAGYRKPPEWRQTIEVLLDRR